MSFLRRIIFDINTKKSKYIFFENKEKFLLFTRDQVISKECFANDNFEFEKFQKVIDFLKKDYQMFPNYLFDLQIIFLIVLETEHKLYTLGIFLLITLA